MWDVTPLCCMFVLYVGISTHTSRVGCDVQACPKGILPRVFLLTHPVWDVTAHLEKGVGRLEFLLTHPVWDVTPVEPHEHI